MHQAGTATQEQSPVKYLSIDSDQAGRRIDNYLTSIMRDIPKSRIYQMLRRGEVRVDGKRIKQDYRLQEGDKVRIPPVSHQNRDNGGPERPGAHLLDRVRNSIIYEDSKLIVINKPSGIVVHGGSGRTYGVIELLRLLQPDEADSLQLAHRLDRETSGVLLIARNMKTLSWLHDCFKNRMVIKHYTALLKGRLKQSPLRVDQSMSRTLKRGGERLSRIDDSGKSAETVFKTLRMFGDATLTDVTISTGRTHQIRVHAAEIEHPLAGDDKYGERSYNSKLKKAGLKRLFLHAASISIPAYQGHKALSVKAALPQELEDFLVRYDKRSN